MRKSYLIIMMIVMFSMLLGCTERVPPGYQGMVMQPSGFTGEALQPGNHTCWGRDRMVLIEAKEVTHPEKMKVLCSDDLNFGFDLKVRSRVKQNDGKGIMSLMARQGSNIKWEKDIGILRYNFLYATYIQDSARSIARGVVSKYQTTSISENRETIEKDIKVKLLKAVEGTPVEITMIATSNFDYPEVITMAMERKKEREIAIDTEEANQAIALLQATNRLNIAEKMKAVRAAEARAEAIYIEIVGEAITSSYLGMRGIERDIVLYGNVGPGDKVIVTNGNHVSPIVGSLATRHENNQPNDE